MIPHYKPTIRFRCANLHSHTIVFFFCVRSFAQWGLKKSESSFLFLCYWDFTRFFINFHTRAVLLSKNGKNSPNQYTDLGNRGRLKVLNDNKLVLNEHEWPLNHLGSIWYHSEPSDVPHFPKKILGWDFFCRFLQPTGSKPFYICQLKCQV